MSIIKGYILFGIAWIVFYALHSWLAHDSTKQFVLEKIPFLGNQYRLYYSLVSIISFLPIGYFSLVVEPVKIISGSEALKVISYAIGVMGVVLIKKAFKYHSIARFLGFKQGKNHTEGLITEGIHGKIRHPIYTGTILIFLSYFLFSPYLTALISLVLTLLYLPIGIALEEKKLIDEYGEAYHEYKKHVPSLIPNTWF